MGCFFQFLFYLYNFLHLHFVNKANVLLLSLVNKVFRSNVLIFSGNQVC